MWISERLSHINGNYIYTKCPLNDNQHHALAEVAEFPDKLMCRHGIIWDDVDVLLLHASSDAVTRIAEDVDKLADMLEKQHYHAVRYIQFYLKEGLLQNET